VFTVELDRIPNEDVLVGDGAHFVIMIRFIMLLRHGFLFGNKDGENEHVVKEVQPVIKEETS
jgi:hypothetical protein